MAVEAEAGVASLACGRVKKKVPGGHDFPAKYKWKEGASG